MAVKPPNRRVPRRTQAKRCQERAHRTRALVIEETVRCIHEEGFAAASTRHIIERAGVSWGVIQYHFGDRDGLLTAVIEHAFTTLVTALNDLADTAETVSDVDQRAEALTTAAWKVLHTPMSMTAFEILIATRFMRGTLSMSQLAGLEAAFSRIASAIGATTPHAAGVTNLLWASPVGMMVAQMVISVPLPTEQEQRALAALISDHLKANRSTRDSNDGKRKQVGSVARRTRR